MEPLIREIEASDAEAFASLRSRLEDESDYMLFEAGEASRDPAKEEKKINEIKEDPYKEIYLLEDDGCLVGFIAVMGEGINRIKHRASVVIGILEAYNGRGYGKKLFQKAEQWAREKGIKRLELTVMTHNKRALWLYSTVGFNVEGIRRNALIVAGKYVDEFYMGKMF
ncbi:MAG: GNAT family N-acetyltransferase [Tuberibacillus sp.]